MLAILIAVLRSSLSDVSVEWGDFLRLLLNISAVAATTISGLSLPPIAVAAVSCLLLSTIATVRLSWLTKHVLLNDLYIALLSLRCIRFVVRIDLIALSQQVMVLIVEAFVVGSLLSKAPLVLIFDAPVMLSVALESCGLWLVSSGPAIMLLGCREERSCLDRGDHHGRKAREKFHLKINSLPLFQSFVS